MTRTVRIGVGDDSVPWTLVEPTAARRRVVRVHRGTAREVGTVTEHIRVFEDGDLPVVERTQILNSPELGDRVETTVMERTTFSPVRHRSIMGAERMEVAYESPRARTRRIRNGVVADTRDVEVSASAFDSHAIELVLRLLPLGEGYRVALPAFDANAGEEIEVVAEVLGMEDIDNGAGTITPVWSVDLAWGAHHQRYWLARDGSDIVRQTVRLPDGAVIAFIA